MMKPSSYLWRGGEGGGEEDDIIMLRHDMGIHTHTHTHTRYRPLCPHSEAGRPALLGYLHCPYHRGTESYVL